MYGSNMVIVDLLYVTKSSLAILALMTITYMRNHGDGSRSSCNSVCASGSNHTRRCLENELELLMRSLSHTGHGQKHTKAFTHSHESNAPHRHVYFVIFYTQLFKHNGTIQLRTVSFPFYQLPVLCCLFIKTKAFKRRI